MPTPSRRPAGGSSADADAACMAEELECAVCRDVMCDPRVLSCQHVFCLRCIDLSSDRAQLTPGLGDPVAAFASDDDDDDGAAFDAGDDRFNAVVSPSAHPSLHGAMFTASGGSAVTVKCPFGCGRTSVSDVRSLPRNVLVTKLCQGLRERTHRRAVAAGEPQACDMCCAEDVDRTLCGKCAAVLCAACAAGETHTFFCGVATRSFPFTIAWEAARAGLVAKLGERGVGPQAVRITRVRRSAVPCHFLQVKATTRIGSAETACTREVLVVADTSLNTTASATPETFLRDCVEYFHVVSSASRSRSPSALSRIHSAASASLACSYGKQQAQQQRTGPNAGNDSTPSSSPSASSSSAPSAPVQPRAAFDACSLHQRDGAAPRPVASTQLSFLCKLQEVKARQGCLLRIAADLLAAPQLAQALRTPDVRGVERDRWGGGLANDVASLLGLLLTLYKQLCHPLYRKIRMLATLEGMRHHAASTHSAVAGLTPELSRRYRQEIRTHLQMVFCSEAALDKLTREEDQLYEFLDAEVQRMLAEQHVVYQQWRQGIASVHLDPAAAVLKGAGVRLRACPQAPGSGANVVTHLPPNGSVEYALSAPLSGADRVDLWYAAPHATSIRLVLRAAGAAEACTDVHVGLASTGGWANFAVKTVALPCPLFGDAVLTLAKPAGCGADPPDVSRVTVSGACRSGTAAAAAAATAAAATPQQRRAGAGVPAAGHASPLHEQVLSILGFCHASQLDLFEAYDKLYRQCGKQYWGANMSREVQQKDAIIATDRLELLNRLKDIQQARIVQRQWFHCASVGFVDDGSSGASPDNSAALLPVIVVLPCSPHSAAEALPNLLQTLEPRIHEFREEQQHNMDAPLSHLQEQIRRVLWQTLELLQREQILQLRESLQQTKEALVLHMAPGGTDLWAPLRPAEACVWPAWATGDVHELQVIQMLWSNAAARLGNDSGHGNGNGNGKSSNGDSSGSDPDGATAGESPADSAAGAAASTASTPADVQVGGRLLSKIAMSLKKYAKAVVTSLEAVKASREGGGGGGGGVEGVAATKGDAAAAVLADHLRVVVTLRDALAAAQASPSYIGRLKLLSQALFILRRLKEGWRTLQAELGGSGGPVPRSACEGAVASEAAAEAGEAGVADTPEADPVDEEGAALLEWFLERPAVERWHSLQENFGAAAECWDEADTGGGGGGGDSGTNGEKEVVAYDRAQIRDTAIALSKGRKGGEIAAAAAAAAAASSGGGAQEGEGVPSASLSHLLLLYSEHSAPPNESVDMHVTHSIDATDFQTLLKLPYYHGTYEVLDASGESTGVSYPFAVNGQDAVLHFACPPQSWGGWACSMLTAALTRPLPYLAFHALAVALRWKG